MNVTHIFAIAGNGCLELTTYYKVTISLSIVNLERGYMNTLQHDPVIAIGRVCITKAAI